MIVRQIKRIDYSKRMLGAVHFRHGYGTIQCNNGARSNYHELIVKR